jgi:hypothetical protein
MCRETRKISAPKGPIALPAVARKQRLDSPKEKIEARNSQERQRDIKKTSRHVRFECDNTVVHKTEPMSDEEFKAYYMQPEDFDRVDNDIRESIIKWVDHEAGKNNVDPESYSVRGLEDLIDHIKTIHCSKNSRVQEKDLHSQVVLQAVREQQTTGVGMLDTEQLRLVSERSSSLAQHRALQIAKTDESDLSVSEHMNPSNPLLQQKPVEAKIATPTKRSGKTRRILSYLRRASQC